eukprot:SAG22_NODE_2474_length_2533_cov_1.889071_2_plen_308_part_00
MAKRYLPYSRPEDGQELIAVVFEPEDVKENAVVYRYLGLKTQAQLPAVLIVDTKIRDLDGSRASTKVWRLPLAGDSRERCEAQNVERALQAYFSNRTEEAGEEDEEGLITMQRTFDHVIGEREEEEEAAVAAEEATPVDKGTAPDMAAAGSDRLPSPRQPTRVEEARNVPEFLAALSLSQYEGLFREEEIDLAALRLLGGAELKELGPLHLRRLRRTRLVDLQQRVLDSDGLRDAREPQSASRGRRRPICPSVSSTPSLEHNQVQLLFTVTGLRQGYGGESEPATRADPAPAPVPRPETCGQNRFSR